MPEEGGIGEALTQLGGGVPAVPRHSILPRVLALLGTLRQTGVTHASRAASLGDVYIFQAG